MNETPLIEAILSVFLNLKYMTLKGIQKSGMLTPLTMARARKCFIDESEYKSRYDTIKSTIDILM